MKISVIKSFTILAITLCTVSIYAQPLHFCVFDNPKMDVATTTIVSDDIVNQFGDLVSDEYRVENEVNTDAELVKRFYYKDSQLFAQRNYTLEGELIGDEAGIAIYQYEYNSIGDITKIEYFDEDKLAVQAAYAGPAMIQYVYDTKGNRTKATYFDKYHNLLDLGVSIIEYTFDNQNRLTLEKHYNAKEELVKETAPIIKYSYDDNGKMVQQSFLNSNNETVTRLMDDDDYDIARIAYEYEGETISMMHYYNSKGELLGSEKGSK
ncbi:MAG: hypothetical protein AB8G11_19865 [Saprospiraceae bacterium]